MKWRRWTFLWEGLRLRSDRPERSQRSSVRRTCRRAPEGRRATGTTWFPSAAERGTQCVCRARHYKRKQFQPIRRLRGAYVCQLFCVFTGLSIYASRSVKESYTQLKHEAHLTCRWSVCTGGGGGRAQSRYSIRTRSPWASTITKRSPANTQ